MLRFERPLPALVSISAWGAEDGTSLNVWAYLYGDEGAAESEQNQKQWQAWLDELSAATTEPATS